MNNRLLTLEDLYDFYSKKKKSLKFNAEKSGYNIAIQTKATFEVNDDLSEGLLYGKIRAFHDLTNNNKSHIETDVLEDKMMSIKDRPIMADIVDTGETDENGEPIKDFSGHTMYYDEDSDKMIYKEIPVGHFINPENIHLEYDEKLDRNFVCSDVVVYEEYTDTCEILRRRKTVDCSVELCIRAMHWDNTDKTLHLDDFYVQGTTLEEIKSVKSHKTFKPDEEIPCKSVTPWELNATGVDKNTVYHWEYFGDIEYVKYRDLQALRRTEYVTRPAFIILDEDIVSQWKRELGDKYKYFKSIDYPEEYFDMSDDEFENMIKEAPDWLGEIVTDDGGYTAQCTVNVAENTVDPSESHTELESLSVDGNCYFDTEILPDQNTNTEAKLYVKSGTTYICGARDDKYKYGYSVTDNFYVVRGSVSSAVKNTAFWEDAWTIKQNGATATFGNNSVTLDNAGNFTLTSPYYIGCMSKNGEAAGAGLKGKIYYAKIYSGSNLVADMIPVKKSDGTLCLYDKVRKKYIYNAGTGTATE